MSTSRPLVIAPSILAADFAQFGAEVAAVDEAGADWIHVDVMDGHFVPNITFGAQLVEAIRPYTKIPLDVHLMIAPADPHIEDMARAGADGITVHVEAGAHLDRSLQTIRNLGKRAGVAINPGTPETAIEYVLDRVDLITVMTVNPGFGGQAFVRSTLDKIARVREMIADRPIDIQVDGGISVETAGDVASAGANVLVAGTAIYKGDGAADYRVNMDAIRAVARPTQ